MHHVKHVTQSVLSRQVIVTDDKSLSCNDYHAWNTVEKNECF
jgi:hypothetical protein